MTSTAALAPDMRTWAKGQLQQAKELALEHSPTTTVGLLAWVTFGCCAITAGAAILSTSAFALSGILTGLLLALSAGSVMLGFVLGGVACLAGCFTALCASMVTSAWIINLCIKTWLHCLSYLSPDMHAWLVQRFESWHLPGLMRSFIQNHMAPPQLPGPTADRPFSVSRSITHGAPGAHPQQHQRQDPAPKPLRINTKSLGNRALSKSCDSLTNACLDGGRDEAETDVPDACFDEQDQEVCTHPTQLFQNEASFDDVAQDGEVDHVTQALLDHQLRMMMPAVSAAAPTQRTEKAVDDAVSATMLEPAAA